jgi:hypothetical protein
VMKWTQQCNQEHADCKPFCDRMPELPTRVLDLNTSSDNLDLRLIDSRNLTGRYMTLSHCWGLAKPLSTTIHNIQARKENLSMDTLPPTFRDAVVLTRALNIRYLWIDSLCIIQDDIGDWELESSKMATVYSNSYLNIAATSAQDCQEGLFKKDLGRCWKVGAPLEGKPVVYTRRTARHAHCDVLDSLNYHYTHPLVCSQSLAPYNLHIFSMSLCQYADSKLASKGMGVPRKAPESTSGPLC